MEYHNTKGTKTVVMRGGLVVFLHINMMYFASRPQVLSGSMSSSEISFDNILLCNLTINTRMSKCQAKKAEKNYKIAGKGRGGTTF